MIYEEGTVFRPRGGTLKTLLLLGIVCSSVSELFVQLSQNKMCLFVCLFVCLWGLVLGLLLQAVQITRMS